MAKVNEKSRTYHFPNRDMFTIKNVRILNVSDSGGHRITTKEGLMFYIPPKWIAIFISSKKGWEA